MRHCNRKLGFTLIEVLLSLSILSIIMVIILGALRIGVRAWEKGENVLAAQQRSRTVLDQLTRQLTSASVLMGAQEEQPLVQFAGDSQTIEFTSGLSLMTKIQIGPVHVKYAIESAPDGKKRLLLYEENITPADYLSERQLRHDTDARVLIGQLEDLHFEYLDAGSIGTEPHLDWTSSWRPRNLTDLPRAVRITYRDKKGRHNLRVIARIYQWDRWSRVEGSTVQKFRSSAVLITRNGDPGGLFSNWCFESNICGSAFQARCLAPSRQDAAPTAIATELSKRSARTQNG